eukprot:COSAG05_NODE_3098_length_2323_cov_21.130845_1_plen_22_part_10
MYIVHAPLAQQGGTALQEDGIA